MSLILRLMSFYDDIVTFTCDLTTNGAIDSECVTAAESSWIRSRQRQRYAARPVPSQQLGQVRGRFLLDPDMIAMDPVQPAVQTAVDDSTPFFSAHQPQPEMRAIRTPGKASPIPSRTS